MINALSSHVKKHSNIASAEPVRQMVHANNKSKKASEGHDDRLAAIYEKSEKVKHPSAKQVYMHPQAEHPRKHFDKIRHDIRDWNHAVKAKARAYLDSFEDRLQEIPGAVTEEMMRGWRSELDQWTGTRRSELEDELGEYVPPSLVQPIMKLADRRLDRVENRMWRAMEKAVRKHNGSIPAETPLVQAEKIYREWNDSLSQLSEDYLESIDQRLDDLTSVFSDDQKQQLEQEFTQWLNDQRAELENSMSELPHGIVKKLLEKAESVLREIRDTMWTTIGETITRHNDAVIRVEQLYLTWNESLDGVSQEYLQAIRKDLSQLAVAITDEQKQQMRQALNQWLEEKRESLEKLLKETPAHLTELLLEQAGNTLGMLSGRLWTEIEEEIRKHAQSLPPVIVPPVVLPPVTLPPVLQPQLPGLPSDGRFKPGTIRLEVIKGSLKAELTLQDRSADKGKKPLFYVMDATGNRKAVTLTFSDQRLQNEFEKRFRQSSMYGKTVSLEKFNDFAKRLKSSLEDISETDLQRLRSKLYGKEESSKLVLNIRNFISIVYQMRN